MLDEIKGITVEALELEEVSANPTDLLTFVGRLHGAVAAELGRQATFEEKQLVDLVLMPFNFSLTWEEGPPWQSCFKPVVVTHDQSGAEIYVPDIAQINQEVFAGWKQKARTVKNHVLRARYAHVVWELARKIKEPEQREVEFARIAARAYLESYEGSDHSDLYRFDHLRRAAAIMARVKGAADWDKLKNYILEEHRYAHALPDGGLIFRAFDFLAESRVVVLSDDEWELIAADLEARFKEFSDAENVSKFNPHFSQFTSARLSKYYQRKADTASIQRLRCGVAQAFEHAAKQASGMRAAYLYRESLGAYKNAQKHEDAERVRRALEAAIVESHKDMIEVSASSTISFEDREQFLRAILAKKNPVQTMANLIFYLMPRIDELTKYVHMMADQSPIAAMMPKQIYDEDRVVATIGSVRDDLPGNLLRACYEDVMLKGVWLQWGLECAIKHFGTAPDDFVALINRTGLFGPDTSFLKIGFEAWHIGDHVKVVHVLIPQLEKGLRLLYSKCGRAKTKEHPKIKGASVVVTMGDILNDESFFEPFEHIGKDANLFLRAVYSDPRGLNLRNNVAHGMVEEGLCSPQISAWVVYSLMLLTFLRFPSAASGME